MNEIPLKDSSHQKRLKFINASEKGSHHYPFH